VGTDLPKIFVAQFTLCAVAAATVLGIIIISSVPDTLLKCDLFSGFIGVERKARVCSSSV
jgi:hypothetical protein